jgi:hypothetical protein
VRRIWFSLVCLLALGPPAAADSPGNPTFLLESIRVEGLERAAPGILIAESRLREGEAYGERELAEAVRRVDRLPFVLSAELELERGSSRGSYVLVIHVQEAERWFFGADLRQAAFDQPLSIDSYRAESRHNAQTGTAGLRFYLGADTMAFLAIADDDGLKAGVTHYDLFGRGIAATVAASHQLCCRQLVLPASLVPELVSFGLGDSTDRYGVSVAIPAGHNQAVRLDASQLVSNQGNAHAVFPGERFSLSGGTLRERRLTLRWVYDTTDDFLLPTTGVAFSAGLEHRQLTITGAVLPLDAPNEDWPRLDLHRQELAVVASAEQVFRLAARSAIIASARGAFGRSGTDVGPGDVGELFDPNAYEVAAEIRHSLDLLGRERTRRYGDLRWEVGGEIGYEGVTPSARTRTPISRATLSTALVLRNAWGVFRLGFSYTAIERRT